MIIVMKPHAPQEAVNRVTDLIQEKGLETHLSVGKEVTIIGVVGDKNRLAGENLRILALGGQAGSNHGKLQAFQPKIPPRAHPRSGGNHEKSARTP